MHLLLAPHLQRTVVAGLVLTFLSTDNGIDSRGDGLADAADGFGGGWNRDNVLLIMRDSRIGSYGSGGAYIEPSEPNSSGFLAAARYWFRNTSSRSRVLKPVDDIATQLLPFTGSPSVGEDGEQMAKERIARITSLPSLLAGTIFSFAVAIALLRTRAASVIGVAIVVTLASGLYFHKRIGGVTGDCFGAANQIAEVAVYLCGAWIV